VEETNDEVDEEEVEEDIEGEVIGFSMVKQTLLSSLHIIWTKLASSSINTTGAFNFSCLFSSSFKCLQRLAISNLQG